MSPDLVPPWTGAPWGSSHCEGHYPPGGRELSLVLFQRRWWEVWVTQLLASGGLSSASGFPRWKLGQSQWGNCTLSSCLLASQPLGLWHIHHLPAYCDCGDLACPSPLLGRAFWLCSRLLPLSEPAWARVGVEDCIRLGGGGWQADLGLLLQQGTSLALLSDKPGCESWLCHFPAKRHRVIFLTTQKLSFLICKVGI